MWAVHRPETLDAEPVDLDRLRVRLHTPRGRWEGVLVQVGDRYAGPDDLASVPAADRYPCGDHEVWEAELRVPTGRFRYRFLLLGSSGRMYAGDRGVSEAAAEAGFFQVPYVFPEQLLGVPRWLRGGTVYQIFVDRFARSRPPRPEWHPWDAPPTPTARYGGDLAGILSRLDYLEDLGVRAIYLTPVFRAGSNHKYDTVDYLQVDPDFGTDEDLVALAQACHARGMGLILDAVFNHTSREFPAFVQAQADPRSPYRDWYLWREGEQPGYEMFDHTPTMPKLATWRRPVQEYLLDVVRTWTSRLSLDGWRLDVANEVSPAFWRRFRETVLELRPEAWILGEVWHLAPGYLEGDLFHAVTDYPSRDALLRFLQRRGDAEDMAALLGQRRASGRWHASLTLLGSHDTPRVRTLLDEDTRAVSQALVLQFSLPGTPQIYYGDEVGMLGGPDPDCRRGMPWDHPPVPALHGLARTLVRARAARPWLTDASVSLLSSPGRMAAAVLRTGPDGRWLGVVSRNPREQVLLPAGESSSGSWHLLVGEGELLRQPHGQLAASVGTSGYAVWVSGP